MNSDFVYQMLYIMGPSTHEELMKKFECGFHAIDEILRQLCKSGKVNHEHLFTKKGHKDQHLFWVRKTQ